MAATSPTVRHTEDVWAYLDRAGAFLRRRPVDHSVLLTVAARHAEEPAPDALWLWVEDGDDVVATAHHTPPFGAYLSTAEAEAVGLLARRLHDLRPDLPGVGGPRPGPEAFVAAWRRCGGGPVRQEHRRGVYVATRVDHPSGVPGALRAARQEDAALLAAWVDDLADEVGIPREPGDQVGPRIEAGRLWVWEDDGAPVSMAAVTGAQSGVSRVNLVWTPVDRRRRGYASAAVAALTARELAVPGRTCMLYTDLANPTSNAIYQAVGYRRVGEAVDLQL